MFTEKVIRDYREGILVDKNSPILAAKALRDRYDQRHQKWAGMAYLGSERSEDALTWNVFRTLQSQGRLWVAEDLLIHRRSHGEAKLLLWCLAPDGASSDLQYVTGDLIRHHDGRFRGQVTEPDVILEGDDYVAVVECKLGGPEERPSHLWEGKGDGPLKRIDGYQKAGPNLFARSMTQGDLYSLYQLVRMAFYADLLGQSLKKQPILAVLGNRANWETRGRGQSVSSAAELWQRFPDACLQQRHLELRHVFWQDFLPLLIDPSLEPLRSYLDSHPMLRQSQA